MIHRKWYIKQLLIRIDVLPCSGSRYPSTLSYAWSRCWRAQCGLHWRLLQPSVITGSKQGRAGCQVTVLCIQFLASKFGNWFLWNTERHWPSYSPDIFPLAFSFCAQATTHLYRRQLSTLHELKIIVNLFCSHHRWSKCENAGYIHQRKNAVELKGSTRRDFEHLIRE